MTFNATELEEFAGGVLRAAGTSPEAARVVAKHLVMSSCSGHESHGISRLAQYVSHLELGNVSGDAEPQIVAETPSTVLCDGGCAFGQYSAARALERAISKASTAGSCVAVIRHATHLGRLGDYAETAAARGYVSLIVTGAAGLDLGWMLLPGTAHRFVGANPWSFGFPAADAPIIFDASMTNVAQGKVHVARSRGEALPPGWVVDADGSPSSDPDVFYRGGGLVPLGGEVAGHKGFGLGLIAALLGGLCMIGDPAPTPVATNLQVGGDFEDSRLAERPWMAGAFMAVIDPRAFGSGSEYASMIEALRRSAHDAHPQGADTVLFPGEFEAASREQSARRGVDLPASIAAELEELSQKFGIEMPAQFRR